MISFDVMVCMSDLLLENKNVESRKDKRRGLSWYSELEAWLRFDPSLNTRSCIKGLLMVRNFYFLAGWGARSVLMKKVILTKNVLLEYHSSMKKKIRKIRIIFDIENSFWKSNFCTLCRAGKARQSIPGCL